MEIKNQSDINLLKNYTLAINCRATHKASHKANHRATQGFTGSGLREAAQSYANGEYSRSSTQSSTQQYIFLPSDPDELVDQLKLLYFEKVGGNDNPQLNEQIIAIVDKLLEYECISPSQHQNMQSYARSNLIS